MDDTFTIWRISDDESVIRVWVFANVLVSGQLVLERYTEFQVCAWKTSGYHDYAVAYDGKSAEGSIDGSVALPRDVLDAAMQMVRWPTH